jgi:hypothetical protein
MPTISQCVSSELRSLPPRTSCINACYGMSSDTSRLWRLIFFGLWHRVVLYMVPTFRRNPPSQFEFNTANQDKNCQALLVCREMSCISYVCKGSYGNVAKPFKSLIFEDLSPYRAVNTLRLGYNRKSVNNIYGNNRCLFWDPYQAHKYSVGRMWNFCLTNRMLHKPLWFEGLRFRPSEPC